jgi:hypothetical protein
MSIGIVRNQPYLSDIPESFEHSWQKEGRKIDLDFIDLKQPFIFKNYKDYYLKNIEKNNNPFDVNGNAKLGYLFSFDPSIAKFFINKINNNKLNKYIKTFENDLENEIKEFREEEEQNQKINSVVIRTYSTEELKKYDEEPFY